MVQRFGFLKKSDKKKIEAFEIWCYHQSLKMGWTIRKSNEWVLEEVDCGERLIGTLYLQKCPLLVIAEG